ncbi:hypothetical protein Pfo_001276 [Paulownia fortunei]|nr:hypothetical protein Pfo_001276 [Paulownia fortunei]
MSQPPQNITTHTAEEDLTLADRFIQAYRSLSSSQRLAYEPLFRETPYREILRLHHEHQRQHQLQKHSSQICMSKLVMYVYHQRNHPPPNSISYWRKFVEEYYDLEAVEKWCFALCNNVEMSRTLSCGDSLIARQCKICQSCSKRHYEANTKLLPQVLRSKFESGLVDEFLHLDVPEGKILPNGNILLKYEKAVRQMDYRQFTVVYEGKLRLTFTKDVKILSWEFCARHVEVRVPPFQPTAPLINESMGRPNAGYVPVSVITPFCFKFLT